MALFGTGRRLVPQRARSRGVVVGEVRREIERLKRRDPHQTEVYEDWLDTILRDYADRILPVDADIADEWGRISVPNPVPMVDGLMEATAKARGMIFVTRNIGDVARTGVRFLNPFETQVANPVCEFYLRA